VATLITPTTTIKKEGKGICTVAEGTSGANVDKLYSTITMMNDLLRKPESWQHIFQARELTQRFAHPFLHQK